MIRLPPKIIFVIITRKQKHRTAASNGSREYHRFCINDR
ncbi:unnamed protein product [Tenebrio molitor]|nr:unnamed protein product [Tenebrio molitor]